MLAFLMMLVVALMPLRRSWAFAPLSDDRARVSVQLGFTGLEPSAQSTLEAQVLQKAQTLLAQARLQPAKSSKDLWIRVNIEKREDEEGNLGFDLAFLGTHDGRAMRWPELGRRCTYCTHGELVETFTQAFAALLRNGIPQARPATASKVAATPVSTTSGRIQQENAHGQAQLASPTPRLLSPKSAMPRIDATPPRASSQAAMRWWGWMGLGLSVAGASGMAASLVTMPRDVPVPGDPTRMYPMRADRATKIGLVVGGVCVVGGLGLFLYDLIDRRVGTKQHARLIRPTSFQF